MIMEKKQKKIVKALLAFLAFAFVLACLPLNGTAQDQSAVFATVDYMKVKPGFEDKYVDLEKNVWKPLHQERINQGKIIGWILFRVLYTGTSDLYNYVTVTVFDNPANLENSWAGVDSPKILAGKDIDKLYKETLNCRDLVKSNLIMREDFAYPEGGPVAYKYIQVDFMKVKPGNEGLYLDVEKTIWKPVHNEFIKAGSRVGWSLWSATFPSGSGLDYQFSTVNYFSDFSKIGMANYTDAFAKAHPGKDINELSKKTGDSRDLVKSELWEVVDEIWKK